MQQAHDHAPTFLQAGFRPFFLLAALAAVTVMVRTLLVFTGLADAPAGGPVSWHGHEMLFGYVAAAATGFLLTAVPNWTATAPVAGTPLLLLVLLWAVARAGLWGGEPAAWAIAADIAFLPAVALLATRPVWRRWQPRAWLPVGVALALGGANAAWHLGGILAAPVVADRALAFATMLIALLIAVIGGRITPAFTRNRMQADGAVPLPRPADWRDAAALAASAAVAVAELVHPLAAAALAAAAAVLHGVRLAGWRGSRAWRDPLLFVLHVGYAWLALGYLVRALDPVVAAAGAWALHGLLAGAAGTMTLAVMSRATLGHTGRPLRAGVVLVLAFVAVQGAAVARLAAPWTGTAAWTLAGVLWSAAFGLYLLRCGPMLLRPRLG